MHFVYVLVCNLNTRRPTSDTFLIQDMSRNMLQFASERFLVGANMRAFAVSFPPPFILFLCSFVYLNAVRKNFMVRFAAMRFPCFSNVQSFQLSWFTGLDMSSLSSDRKCPLGRNLQKTKCCPLTAVRTRRHQWLGHILRMPADRLVRRAVLALGQQT